MHTAFGLIFISAEEHSLDTDYTDDTASKS